MEDQPTQLDFTEFIDSPTQLDDFTDSPTQIDFCFDENPRKGFIMRQETVVDGPVNQIRAKSFLMKQGTVVDMHKSSSKFLSPPKPSSLKRYSSKLLVV
jgi:hypothetical protein